MTSKEVLHILLNNEFFTIINKEITNEEGISTELGISLHKSDRETIARLIELHQIEKEYQELIKNPSG